MTLDSATVFYSWESDLPGKTTRNLIEGCLNKAIRQLGREDDLDVDPSLDRDTRGVSGSPVILDAILEKIDSCTAFVADVSIINSKDVQGEGGSRPTPNPNVGIELGYAIKNCGWDRILSVCNEFYGSIAQLPFDIPERRVIAYTLSEDPTPEEVKAAKEKLIGTFKHCLKDILKLSTMPTADICLGEPDSEVIYESPILCKLNRIQFSDFPNNEFPDYRSGGNSIGMGLTMAEPGMNRNYYRDVAKYTLSKNLTKQFSFAIRNNSGKPLKSPRLEVIIEHVDLKVIAFDEDSFPDEPNISLLANIGIPSMLERRARKNVAALKQSDDRIIIRTELDDIQPKRTAWTTCCFLGANTNSLILKCRIYADNLSRPFEQEIEMGFSIGDASKSLQEWIDSDFLADSSDSVGSEVEVVEE